MTDQTKCFQCDDGVLVNRTVDLIGYRNGEEFPVRVPGVACTQCDMKTIDNAQSGAFTKAVSDAYRNAHGLLTGAEILDRRQRLKMSQAQFADYLNVGIASVKRWESGQIQEASMDCLMRLKTDEVRDRQIYRPSSSHWEQLTLDDPNFIWAASEEPWAA